VHISTAVFGQYDGIHGLTPPPGVRWVDHLFFLSGNIFPFFFPSEEEGKKKKCRIYYDIPLIVLFGWRLWVLLFLFQQLVSIRCCCRTTQQRSREEEIPFVGTKCSTTAPASVCCFFARVDVEWTRRRRATTSRNALFPDLSFLFVEKVRYWRGVVYHTGTPGRSVHRQTLFSLSLFLSPPLTHIPPSFFLSFLPSFLFLPSPYSTVIMTKETLCT